MTYTYHLVTLGYPRRLVVVIEARSAAEAIETADTLDPDSRLLLLSNGPSRVQRERTA